MLFSAHACLTAGLRSVLKEGGESIKEWTKDEHNGMSNELTVANQANYTI